MRTPSSFREDVRIRTVVRRRRDGGRRVGEDVQRPKNYKIRTIGDGIIRGISVFYRSAPLPPSAFQVLIEAQSGIEASGTGSPVGQSCRRPDRNCLELGEGGWQVKV